MIKPSQELERVAKENKISIEKLDLDLQTRLMNSLLRKYSKSNDKNLILWDNLIESIGYHSEHAWQWTNAFTKNKPIILFFPFHLNEPAYLIRDSGDLITLIAEMPLFVYYITDDSTSWMICYTDHDVLLGVGDAMHWVDSLRGDDNLKN